MATVQPGPDWAKASLYLTEMADGQLTGRIEIDELRAEITTIEWQLSEATKAAERFRAALEEIQVISRVSLLPDRVNQIVADALCQT